MERVDSGILIKEAQKGGYAVAAMNASNMEGVAAILGAASALDAPVLLQVSPLQMIAQGFTYKRIVKIIEAVAAELPNGRYGIHLDHSETIADCTDALEAGFDSVMLDGAALPYEENVALMAKMRATTTNVLEGELGVVGGGEAGSSDIAMHYTDPDAVVDFVAKTGVDWLAVAIGNAHGVYHGEPKLDFDVLQAIRNKTDVPLVLHGASGIPHKDLKTAIGMGIAKINFFTELDMVFKAAWLEEAKSGAYMMKIARAAQDAMQAKAEELIAVTSCK